MQHEYRADLFVTYSSNVNQIVRSNVLFKTCLKSESLKLPLRPEL